MKLNRAAQILLTIVIVGIASFLVASKPFYDGAVVNAFFSFALASVLIIHFRICPSWQDGFAVLALSLLITGIDFRILHFRPWIMDWLSFPGLSSLIVLALRTVWAKKEDSKRMLLAFIPSAMFVTSEYFASTFLEWTATAHPKVLDLYLFSFDSALHIQLPFLLGQAFATWFPLRLLCLIFYIGLPIPIALIYAGRVLRFSHKALAAFIAFIATGPVGIIFYNIFPALGPSHLFLRAFPWHPLTIEQASRLVVEPIAISGAPNAIPSLHMGWVLLVWWYSRGLSWWERSIAFAFLFFTVLATMGTGEHYLIDLIVAFPFALLIKSLCAFSLSVTNKPRVTGISFGFIGTLGWLLLLRHATHFFWRSPVLPWIFCIATVAFSVVLENRLQKELGTESLGEETVSPVLSTNGQISPSTAHN